MGVDICIRGRVRGVCVTMWKRDDKHEENLKRIAICVSLCLQCSTIYTSPAD